MRLSYSPSRTLRSLICLVLALMLSFQAVVTAAAETAVARKPVIPVTPETLEQFFDDFVRDELDSRNVAGALVAAVRSDQVLITKGYGYANVPAGRAMDPQRSVFRAASVSKLFTATALLQLAEQGRIDLHADINQYLSSFQVPVQFGKPITAAHLLTHTAGFDERILQVRFDDPGLVSSLLADVSGGMPPSVRPPGTVISYSNYGYALAGHLVEAVTGMLFEDYIETHIFRPLGMSRSAFAEPPAADLLDDLVVTYAYRGSDHVAYAPLYHNQRPAGALYTTAEDLARFAAAHLNMGTYQGAAILARDTAVMMQTPQFAHHPALEGWGYGFYEVDQRGIRTISHDGDLNGAYSVVYLMPELDFGMVLHFNTGVAATTESDPRAKLLARFLDRFYPESVAAGLVVNPPTPDRLADLSGYYRPTRYAQQSPGKILMPMALAQFVVTQDAAGRVRIAMPTGLVPETEWVPHGEGLFRRADQESLLAYRQNDRGKVEHIYFSSPGPMAIERVPWYEVYWLVIGLLLFAVITFAGILIGWPLLAIVRWFRPKRSDGAPAAAIHARWLSRGIGTVGMLLAALVGIMISQVMVTLNSPLLGLLPMIVVMGWVIALGSIWLLVCTVSLWRAGQGRWFQQTAYGLAGLAGLSFTYFLYFGNLLWFTAVQ